MTAHPSPDHRPSTGPSGPQNLSGEPFGARLRRAMDERGPLCVGIDPHASLLHDWGLNDDVAGLERFSRTVVEALAGRVAVMKPQSAFFERFGSRGVAVLERTVQEAREAGTLVVMDAKRGDIGSTMAAYAEAFLEKGAPLFSDALTVSPYLGYGSLQPAVDLARESGAGLFVLALTSNPEGGQVQHAVREDGLNVGATMLAYLAAENAGERPMGSFGAVVGATLGDLSSYDLDINGPLLAPGVGAQGATPADLRAVFGPALRNVVPNVSRGVLRHGPGVVALRDASDRFADEIRAAVAAT
ncbi:orotidine-5'-phosphate decarboxylase [Streptomyces sp. WI04-05B]|uniref:orotidine-5'-phosphate decarboxylase n=1 Tax=Streptomyces TaxID=1883 RepID=UPI0029B11213|nr:MULTISPECIES: orotidine-5'-phosphate decarboxylase [unclassified Streptomyces]MDX2540723.1 orotidine-5'-phosphate decarboxylase [Streptomyces sp. WI04-05B]MDX2585840.1 orotidine-5'-phosphate decarboxylase [Streptomyces sp. WI04-05A]MDX3746126.1 orotidine-5'-phosphate decarboxylase [Streptomyces sp. AK08-02]